MNGTLALSEFSVAGSINYMDEVHKRFSSEKGRLKAVQTSFLNFLFVMEEEKDK